MVTLQELRILCKHFDIDRYHVLHLTGQRPQDINMFFNGYEPYNNANWMKLKDRLIMLIRLKMHEAW